MTEVFPKLFSPLKLAGRTLPKRIAMAPLTRHMAQPNGAPTDEMAAYFARRARGGCGLIITEGYTLAYPIAVEDPKWSTSW